MARGQVQDAYEQRLLEIVALTMNGQHDRALEILQALERTYAPLDKDGWLHRSVVSHRGLILADRGDLTGALEAYRQAQQYPLREGAAALSDYVVNQLAISRILDKMGDSAGAIRELEAGLDAAVGPVVATAFNLLVLYALIARRSGLAMPTRYRELLEASCQRLGLPVTPSKETESLIEAVLTADAVRQRSQAH